MISRRMLDRLGIRRAPSIFADIRTGERVLGSWRRPANGCDGQSSYMDPVHLPASAFASRNWSGVRRPLTVSHSSLAPSSPLLRARPSHARAATWS